MTQGLAGFVDAFTPATAREALGALRQADRGALLVTNGVRDLRLRRTDGGLLLEGLGVQVQPGGPRELIRQVLCALFWEDAVVLSEAEAEARDGVSALRLDGDALPVLEQLEQGLVELEGLRLQVPALDALVAVSGEAPPPEEQSPTARLFRAAKGAQGGQVVLGAVAHELGLDALDAAWAVADLLEVKQATVKRPPPTVAARRVKRAEGLVDQGFSAGLRCAQVARGHARADPKRAATWLRRAGDAFLADGRHDGAASAYRACLEARADDLAAREGLVAAHVAAGRGADADRLRAELARTWAGVGQPQRARRHLELLAEPSAEQRALLLECLLAAGDFDAAAELAPRLALAPPERAALAARFAAAGARGPALARAVALSGVQALRPVARLLWALAAALVVAAAALGVEEHLRGRLAEAGAAARAAVVVRDYAAARAAFAELDALARRSPVALPPTTCLALVAPALQAVDALEADQGLLDGARATLAWRDAPDVAAADAALAALLERARTDALRRVLGQYRAEVAEYRAHVLDDVKRLDELNLSGKLGDALELARTLVSDHARARDAWAGRDLPVHVAARPVDALVTVGGARLRPLAEGEYEARVPLDGRPVVLTVEAPSHVTRRVTLRFAELQGPSLEVELVKRLREPTLTPPAWPAGVAWPAVVAVEDPVGLARAATVARGALRAPPVVEAGLAAVAERLLPTQRLLLVARSEVKARRVVLEAVDVFLEDVADPAAPRRATPVRLSPGRPERAPVDDGQGAQALPPLSALPVLPALREALLEVVAEQQAELGP